MATRDDLARAWKSNRGHWQAALLSLAVAVVALVLGTAAHRRSAPARSEASALESAERLVEQFRSSFRQASPAEQAGWQHGLDSLGIGMAGGTKLQLAQSIAHGAEAAGLRSIEVRFGTADSAFVPPRGGGDFVAVAPANYTVVISGVGGFANVVTFVNSLPPAVSVIRLDAARDKAVTRYRISLAVYENTNGTKSG